MVILLGNQKGGAGKSTLCLLLANYLTQVKGQKVNVLDMDYQQSLAAKAEKAKILENKPLYEIIPADLKLFPTLFKVLQSQNQGELVLIDLPGKMDDDGLIPVFRAGELILCPFAYDEFSIDSTVLFAMVARELNDKAPIVFIPNRVKTTVKYETRTEVDRVLTQFGAVTAELTDRIDFQRVSTFHTPLILQEIVLPVLDLIYDYYLLKEDKK